MDAFFLILEYAGIFAFSVSGAMIAVDKGADIVGVIILALVTSFGGGIIRDVFLGHYPPRFFTDYYVHIAISVISAIVVFLFAYFRQRAYLRNEAKIDSVINVFDAAGLGIFAIYSTIIAIESGFSTPLVAISMGIIGSVCGGLVRDLMLDTIPFILRKHIYLLAAAIGATAFYILSIALAVNVVVATLIGVITTFALRILATIFKWNMPRVVFKAVENISSPSNK